MSDFIVEKPVKRKGKKGKGAAPAAPAKPATPATSAPESSPATEEAKDEFDAIYNPETLAHCFPRGWQTAFVQPSFLLQKKDSTSSSDKRDYYFNGKQGEGAVVFWSTSEVIFLLVNLL